MVGRIERRLNELGIVLPAHPRLPPGVTVSFEWMRMSSNLAFAPHRGPTAAPHFDRHINPSAALGNPVGDRSEFPRP
jgi:hypothetical protein